jgi:nitrite reductase/ring-hydroxylating ferredoxin subunit
MSESWHPLGQISELKRRELAQVSVDRVRLALSCVEGEFGAVSGVCNHVGGPLGEGRLAGEYIVCPWHNWKYHMERNVAEVRENQELHQGARELAHRAVDLAKVLLANELQSTKTERGGRKAHALK